MRITAPVTDYVRASVLTTQGDLIQRGAAIPQRLAAVGGGRILSSDGVGNLVSYRDFFNLFVTTGDLFIKSPAAYQALAAGAAGTYLQGKGAGVLPAYEQTMPPLTTKGDLIEQGATVPVRIAAGGVGQVFTGQGAGNYSTWKDLFSLLTARGDLWVRGATVPGRIAAGALDTYFKAQGAGNYPIYEKMALRDTGVFIGNSARGTAGDQVITGVGFRPSVVIFLTTDHTTTNLNWSAGFDDGTVHKVMAQQDNGTTINVLDTSSLRIFKDVSNSLVGSITALGDDGFMITWTLTGSTECYFIYLCLP